MSKPTLTLSWTVIFFISLVFISARASDSAETEEIHSNWVQGSFEHSDHIGTTTLTYSARHVNGIVQVNPEQLLGLVQEKVQFLDNKIVLEFQSAKFANAVNIKVGTILTAVTSIGALIQEVLELQVVESKIVVVTRPVELHKLFHEAEIKFYTNKFPFDQDESSEHEEIKTYSTLESRHDKISSDAALIDPFEWIRSKILAVVEGIKQFAADVTTITKILLASYGVKDIKLDNGETRKDDFKDFLNYNYDETKKAAKNPIAFVKANPNGESIVCNSCYTRMFGGIYFYMNVKNSQLISAEISTSANLQNSFDMDVIAEKLEFSIRTFLFTASAKPIVFAVGPIPISLNLTLAVSAGISGSAKSSRVGLVANLESQVKVGAAYNSTTGWKSISGHFPSGKGRVKSAATVTELAIALDLSPTLTLGISQIGYVGAGLKYMVETTAAKSDVGQCAIPFVSSWGIFSNMIVGVGVELFGKKFGVEASLFPTELYRENFAQGCLVPSANAPRFLPRVDVGTMWSGAVSSKQNCVEKVTGTASAQLLEIIDKDVWNILVTVNAKFENKTAEDENCVWQLRDLFSIQPDNRVAVIPFDDPKPEYKNCGSSKARLDSTLLWQGKTNAQRTTIEITSDNGCYKMALKQFTPTAEALELIK